jgi:TonB family protein
LDDRVGDILTRRAALDAGPAPAIAVSLLLHGGLCAFAVWSAMHAPPVTTASVLNIKFASAVPTPMTVPSPAAEKPKPIAPRIEPPKPKPEDVKPSTAKPVPNTVPLSPFGKSTRKGSANPVTQTTPPPAPAAQAAIRQVGTTGVTGLEGGDFPYTMYIESMKRLIGTHWLRPQSAGNVLTTIRFTIDRDGSIRDVKVETPSTNPTFDRAAQRAILESTPLPPLPYGYGGTYLGVHLTFR